MTPYLLTSDAEQDLLQIGDVTHDRFGLDQALTTHDKLHAAFAMLVDHPEAGHVREDITPPGKNLRYWTVMGRFLIVYRPDTSPLEIIRVVDGARNIAALLRQQQHDDETSET